MRVVALAVLVACLWSARAAAQTSSDPLLPGRFELATGTFWMGGMSFGTVDANERTASGGSYRLFSTDTGLTGSGGLSASVGVQISRSWQVEVVASYSAARLRTLVTGDVENAANITPSEIVSEIMVDGNLLVRLGRLRIGPRTLPFLVGGAGLTRDLHQGPTLLVTGGPTFHFGGGVTHLLGVREGFLKGVGLKADVRVEVHRQGITLDPPMAAMPSVAVSLFGRF